MPSDALQAISPLDGRYAAATAPLREFFSEAALIRERIRIEALWLLHLSASAPTLAGAKLPAAVAAQARALVAEPASGAAAAVKQLELRINHDVKAVEYYVRGVLTGAGANAATLELVHFACTSEDINNLAYARLLLGCRQQLLLPALRKLSGTLAQLAHEHAALPMLARTHGQPATPTTLGKEWANVAARLQWAEQRLVGVNIFGKWNGAVGNFNAHLAALPALDWPEIAQRFVEAQQLAWNGYTTQIEPHDWIGEYCDACAAANVILIDLCRDVWGYIALGYLRQQPVAGEVGSSTMPHKINPIDFENAEGNLGIANALLRHFSEKLPISRWQRDLTDSTVMRNLGVAFGHMLIACRALGRGLAKISPDPQRISADLDEAWEVLGEAIQTVLRAEGVPNGYELLKEFSRGQKIDAAAVRRFLATLPLSAVARDRLGQLRPREYLGLAAELARNFPIRG
jgi:adenylosuccinate lyase